MQQNLQTQKRTTPIWDADMFLKHVGEPIGVSDWVCVDQNLINGFAEATGDRAFIHVDAERAQASRFKGTIAHGLLTLSLLPFFARSGMPRLRQAKVGANYGFDRVRFIAPVPVDRRIRAHFTLKNFDEPKPGEFRCALTVTVELEASSRPAATADWRLIYWQS